MDDKLINNQLLFMLLNLLVKSLMLMFPETAY